MLKAKRKLRWERAWVAVGVVCAVVTWPAVSFAQSAGTGSPVPPLPGATPAAGQNQLPTQPPTPVYTPGQTPDAAQNQDADQSQDASANPDNSSADANQNSALPVAKNLETGLPLRTVMSPLHWGHLSLLSFQGLEIYDSNYRPQQAIAGRQLTALQGLVVYSIQKARSSLNLQYSPYVWFSQNTTYKNLTANAADLATSHIINRVWSFSLNDDFQYSPNLANTLQSGFAADFVSNTSSQTAFLSAGRKALYNNGTISVNAQVSERSHLTFNVMDDYVRLGSYVNALNTTLPGVSQEMNAYGGGAGWTRQMNGKTSISLNYSYRRQLVSLGADSNYNNVSLGISRILKPGLTFSIEGGPGWDQSSVRTPSGTQNRALTTAQGMAQLYKGFREGGIAVSFYRNSQYNGIISNGYNNRYDVSVNRRLFTRWNVLLSASYIQQQFIGARTSTGELGWAQVGYMLSRNWSVFTGYRYLNLSGNQAWSGPQQMAAAGIRWAWQPQNAHR